MKKNSINLLILTFLFGAPFISLSSVKINEIAWMGTETSSYGEWIELYNDADVEMDLSGAGLYEDGGNILIIKLTKKIGPKSYYLIERVTPSNPDPIPEIADDMGSFGGSGFKNLPGGEYLVLKASDGSILDSIDASSGWPAGESDTKNGVKTMQLNGSSWITATATPKSINADTSSDIDNNAPTTTEETTTEISSENNQTISYSSHSSPVELSQPIEKIKVSLFSGRNRISMSDSPVSFSGKFIDASGKTILGGSFNWSFGDGTSAANQQILHSYNLPGEYIVILNANYEGDEYVGRSFIKIIEPNFDIKVENDVLFIQNNLANEINLKGWRVVNGNRVFTFQNDTIILAGKRNPFILKILGFDKIEGAKIDLVSPNNKIVSSYQDRSLIEGKVVSVEKTDNSELKLELSRLENELKILQKSLIANISPVNIIEPIKEKQVLSKNVKILEEVKKDTESTGSEKRVIVLEPQKNESVIWSFFKTLFYR